MRDIAPIRSHGPEDRQITLTTVTARTESQPVTTPALDPAAHPTMRQRVLSMRILEFGLALGALATAILLGLSR